ncbi:sugar phosphate isomerase/epimerase [Tamlana fucoidanivorans]|nr:TIM barrel protein [Tamlana fucoidanivorans]
MEVNNQQGNPFFVYNFGGLELLESKAQIEKLKTYGYDGISLRMAKAEHVKQLPEFIAYANKIKEFKIYSVFIRYNFADNEIDRTRWQRVVDIIKNQGIDLWVIFGKKEPGVDDEHVEGVLKNMVNYAANRNVSVTLYPHSWCYFYTAEQSLPMVKKINHPNLKLAVHTCHELKAGNGNRLAEVVENVKDYISFVTIAGAQAKVDMSSRRSMDQGTIMPLEDGTFDYSHFLKALNEVNYRGPIGYINFGFDKEPDIYLPLSMQKWQQLKTNYLSE